MYSNLLKMGVTDLQNVEKRVIDNNEMVAHRMEKLAAQASQSGNMGLAGSRDGFAAGLSAEQLEGVPSQGEDGDGIHGNVIKADSGEDYEAALADAHAAAEDIIEQARAQAQAEADGLIADAKAQIEHEREDVFAQARDEGYQEGMRQAEQEMAVKLQELAEKENALEAEYGEMVGQLEPQLVDAIADVYGHLFGVELAGYREILLHLILSAVRKIEGSRDFLVHVSAEDYPYVSMEKKQLMTALASPGATLELVEDVTLSRNECMIETEAGIFDCGLGTQLAELTQKLKLLSYEKA